LASSWQRSDFAAKASADVSEIRCSDIGPGFRDVNVAHARFDHRAQPFTRWTQTKIAVNGLMLTGSYRPHSST